jgi:restriction system protein
MSETVIPARRELLWPTIEAVRKLGGSASIDEIVEAVIEQEKFSEEQQQILHGNTGPKSEIEYRLSWARTYLKRMGLLDNSQRGVWSLKESGRSVTPADVTRLHVQSAAQARDERRKRQIGGGPTTDDDDESREAAWQDQLLVALLGMAPSGFERLVQRLLREAGFISATVTGRTGDGGIDGLGVYRISLVSFPVFFQCKRYKGSVGAGAVRDFRGAMAGRGDKGLLVTTGTFTGDAKAEATRDGATPIDLIDGLRLCELLKQYDLGVKTTIRQVEDVAVDPDFFADS